MSGLLLSLLRYQAWANAQLFDKLEQLDSTQHKDARHAAIRLINHSHVVARIFTGHLTGRAHGYTADNTEATPELPALRAAVAASDHWYLDYIRTVPAADLSAFVAFEFTDGDKASMSREEMITHVVTHAGYHRGEVGRILRSLGITPPWDTFAVFLHQDDPARRQQAQ